ncbi:MAG: HNH endonuclease [candidate division KSB1 bacterium]|nr:HNH endonuclease [candidate division KSB1 bacterium]
MKIYIWNLTHGGGSKRPTDEYRIQITGIDRFVPEYDGKTLILGWWKEGEVFAGFDFKRHSSDFGFSPSIQIREQALRKAYIKGIAPWEKGNQEISIAFRPDFFVEYVRNLEVLHTFGESKQDYDILDRVTENPDEINDTEIEKVTQYRKTTLRNVKKRIRDYSFQSRVLTSYSNRCAFCGLQLKLVDAAHIIPVQYDGNDETSNGIALCALHHRAYDINLVTFTEEYQVVYDKFRFNELSKLDLDDGAEKFIRNLRSVIHLPPAKSDRPYVDYIKKANSLRGWEN